MKFQNVSFLKFGYIKLNTTNKKMHSEINVYKVLNTF